MSETIDSVVFIPPSVDASGAPQFQLCAAADPASQPQSWTCVAAAVDSAGKVEVEAPTSNSSRDGKCTAIIFLG